MIFIIYMMIEQIQSLLQLKMKYFHQFWSYIDVGIIVCSWTSVGIYIWRYNESKRIGNLFKETNGYVYINLQLAVYINDLLINLLSFCCFFGWIKFVRLCRFNRRILLFIKTLRTCWKRTSFIFIDVFNCIYIISLFILFIIYFKNFIMFKFILNS